MLDSLPHHHSHHTFTMGLDKNKLRALLKKTNAKQSESVSTKDAEASSNQESKVSKPANVVKEDTVKNKRNVDAIADHATSESNSRKKSKTQHSAKSERPKRVNEKNNKIGNPSQSNNTNAQQVKSKQGGKGKIPVSTLDQLKSRLSGSHFRILNEQLYTTDSQNAVRMFNENPALFEIVCRVFALFATVGHHVEFCCK